MFAQENKGDVLNDVTIVGANYAKNDKIYIFDSFN